MVTWIACAVGLVCCLPFAPRLVAEAGDANAGSLAWAVYLGLFPTAIAFTTWAYALARTSAGKMGATTYLVPPLAILLGWAVQGETPPALALAGGVLCLAGAGLARSRDTPRVFRRQVGPYIAAMADPTTTILRLSAFTDTPDGGNPAGVVLDASALTDAQMQQIAADVGYSETAFVTNPTNNTVRYFSPVAEVPFCGHATIATAVALAERDGPGELLLATQAGPIAVTTAARRRRRRDHRDADVGLAHGRVGRGRR